MKKFVLSCSVLILILLLSVNPVYAQEPGVDIENPNINTFSLGVGSVDYASGNVELNWAAVENGNQYSIVYINGQDNTVSEPIISTNELTGSFIIPAYGQNYEIKAVAYDISGQIIAESNVINLFLPKEISDIKTTAISPKKVKLTWRKSDGCSEYKIYKQNDKKIFEEVATVKTNSAGIDVEKDEKYVFKVVGIYSSDLYTVSTNGKKINFNNSKFVNISSQKYTYKEMVSDMKSLCDKYSEYVRYESIGTTKGNRNIYDIILGNPDAKKTLLVVCTLHAREYVATVNGMKQLEYYLENYNRKIDGVKPADIFSNCNIHYVMMANPDGVTISQNSKTTWKANGNGVNLNNNFPFRFRKKGKTSNGTSTGTRALSEKETQAIAKLTQNLKKESKLAVLNYHAMGEIVFGGYEGNNKDVKSMTSKMYKVARNTTGYADAGGYDSLGYGNYREYLMYTLKIPSVTIEVGKTPCPVNKKYYNSIFRKNKYVVLRLAQLL